MNTARERHLVDLSNGFVLPTCLMLLSITSLIATGTLRTALTEAQLASAVIQTRDSFRIVETGIATGLRYAHMHPDSLPESLPDSLPDYSGGIELVGEQHALTIRLVNTTTDTYCPMYSAGERRHYEIIATTPLPSGANRVHTQGFAICREQCPTDACTGAESPPIPTYWFAYTAAPSS